MSSTPLPGMKTDKSKKSGTLNAEHQKIVLEILEQECRKEEDGMFHSEIYADYRDELTKEEILAICRSDDPWDTYDDKIISAYENAEIECENDLLKKIKEEDTISEALENGEFDDDEITNFVRDRHTVDLPFDHFLDQELLINIIVNTGDQNTDFTINQPFASWDGRDDTKIDDDAAILWLARQQGYNKSSLTKALRDRENQGSKFLASMLSEVENVTTHMNALTFLAKMTFSEWFKLHDAIDREKSRNNQFHPRKSKGRGYIILDKNTTCGLYDPWNGAGGPLEIALDKDVRLPIRFIDSAWPDGGRGYSIEDIYAACSCIWDDRAIKEIHPMKKAA